MSLLLAELVAAPRSPCSASTTESPRPAASRAMPTPLMPPPTMRRSICTSTRDSEPVKGKGLQRAMGVPLCSFSAWGPSLRQAVLLPAFAQLLNGRELGDRHRELGLRLRNLELAAAILHRFL